MISLAIAVKEPATSRRYRQMVGQAGFEGHFASTIADLARTVKSRPIDVIVFDLGLSSLPAAEWLSIVSKDRDLGLTPTIWVGTNIPESQKASIAEYRPGTWLNELADPGQLSATVNQLVGRLVDTGTIPKLKLPQDRNKWVPHDEVIDDALQIFEEEDKRQSHSLSKDEFEAQMTNTGAHARRPASPRVTSKPSEPPPPEAVGMGDDSIEVSVSEVTMMPGSTGPKRTVYTSGRRPPTVAQVDLDESGSGGANAAMVDNIVDLVTDRLASKLAKQIDAQLIRREIAAVLRQRETQT